MSRKKAITYFVKEEIKNGHTCPYCGSNVFEVLDAEARWDREEMSDFAFGKAFGLLQCSRCDMTSIIIYDISGDEVYLRNKQERDEYLFYHPEVVDLSWDIYDPIGLTTFLTLQGQYPCLLQFSKATPDEIRQDMNEACDCLAVGANQAAIAMCRRVIEHLAGEFGMQPSSRYPLGTILEELRQIHELGPDRIEKLKGLGPAAFEKLEILAHKPIQVLEKLDPGTFKKLNNLGPEALGLLKDFKPGTLGRLMVSYPETYEKLKGVDSEVIASLEILAQEPINVLRVYYPETFGKVARLGSEILSVLSKFKPRTFAKLKRLEPEHFEKLKYLESGTFGKLIEVNRWGVLGVHTDAHKGTIDAEEAKKVVDFVRNLVLTLYPLEDAYDADKELDELKQLREQRKQRP